MAADMLRKLVCNSLAAISDGVYEVDCSLEQSIMDLRQIIRHARHAALITEIKFASPSLGKIRTRSDPATVARQMIQGGASGLSVLTQPHLFNGSPECLIRVRQAVDVPLLMKDVMVDRVQFDAAQKMGADYVLLIQSLYDRGHLENVDEHISYSHKRGLGVLLEVHDRQEFRRALDTEADLIGINNRNLDTLGIDLATTADVLADHEKTRPIISESGIHTPQDVRYLRDCGADAFLVGSSIMKSRDMAGRVRNLVNAF